MGSIRAFSKRQKWTEEEVGSLKRHYAATSRMELAALFPGRPIRAVECKANSLGLARDRPAPRSAEDARAAKRKHVASVRAADPEAFREYRRAFYRANHEGRKMAMRAYYARRFFWGKAMKLRNDGRATFKDLASIWKRQRGRCALTGVKLGRDAHLDHKLPKARGGNDRPENLQWVTPAVNLAKRDLTDAEFVDMCANVMDWLGQRIAHVEALISEAAA